MVCPPEAILNTSPLLYLHRAGLLDLLPRIFTSCSTTAYVLEELEAGRKQGWDVPSHDHLAFVRLSMPDHLPEEWLSLDLGMGESSVIALAVQVGTGVVILDDLQARRVASAAGLQVWGTLRILIEAKRLGAISSVGPFIDKLINSGMWISDDIRFRILRLSGE